MQRSLKVRAAAEVDILEAAVWYEEQLTGLSGRFLDEVQECKDRITANPFGSALIWRKVRRAKLRKFPYALTTQSLMN